jgi:hypothetical protein
LGLPAAASNRSMWSRQAASGNDGARRSDRSPGCSTTSIVNPSRRCVATNEAQNP